MMETRIVVKNTQLVTLFLIAFAALLKTSDAVTRYHGYYENAVLKSRNYPGEYQNDFEEQWLFTDSYIAEEYRVRLVFNDIAIEMCGGINCTCDSITFYDGRNTGAPLLGKFCGYYIPPPIVSKRNELYVLFKTDSSVVKKGFNITLYIEYNPKTFITDEIERSAINYFLKTKRQQALTTNKWGTDITRSGVALFLYDPRFFDPGNKTGEEIGYELSLQLMSKLVTKKPISTKDLALFINAMTVACINPKSFFGLNLVAELRTRVESSSGTNPFFLLALCIGGDDMKIEDINKLKLLAEADLGVSQTDIQAMVILAVTCINRKLAVSNSIIYSTSWMLRKMQETNGRIENLKTSALVVQALIAANAYDKPFNMSMMMKYIATDLKRAQVDVEEMYYILPIIAWQTLVHINSNHCTNTIQTDLEKMNGIHKDPVELIQIHLSIVIGNNKDFSRTWKIKVPTGSSLHQALESLSSLDPNYKVQYTILKGKSYVAGVGNFKKSIEDNYCWFIYTAHLSSADDLVLVETSPSDIKVNDTSKFILWYRSVFSEDSVQSSTEGPDINEGEFSVGPFLEEGSGE